jgi:hypothetical protein
MSDPVRDSAELGYDIEKMQAEIERTVQLAGLRNDPTLPLLKVLAASFGMQWRLHDQAILHQRDASGQLDRQVAESLRSGEAAMQASKLSIMEQLAPMIANEVSRITKTRLWTIKLRTGLVGTAVVAGLMIFGGCLTYGTGYTAGRAKGEDNGKIIAAAMQAGPESATAWAALMASNNPVLALAACKKAISQDDEGRKSCSMPIWLDPLPGTPQAQSGG